MATKFLEPGGDADFNIANVANGGFWQKLGGSPTIATDFVHGGHIKSIKSVSGLCYVVTPNAVVADAGGRISAYVYINALGSGSQNVLITVETTTDGSVIANLYLTSTGILRLARNQTPTQIGTDGPTLSTGRWYRISLAYTITSSSINRFEVFVDGVSAISVTNATSIITASSCVVFGSQTISTGYDVRFSDHYVDNSSALTDTGDIWVTAKRPFANGTTNGFTTQVGSGGSGYGTGHAPQVNERPLSTTNGWSMVGAGSAITEEYNIEGQGVGDITTVGGTIIDYTGWVSANSLAGETASIIVNNVTSNISLTSTATVFTKIAGSTTYPAGTGTDIGIITSTTLTTVTLNECGVLVAYNPPAGGGGTSHFLNLLGVGT